MSSIWPIDFSVFDFRLNDTNANTTEKSRFSFIVWKTVKQSTESFNLAYSLKSVLKLYFSDKGKNSYTNFGWSPIN